MAELRRHVERVCMRRRELAASTLEMGMAANALGKFESDNCTKDMEIVQPFGSVRRPPTLAACRGYCRVL